MSCLQTLAGLARSCEAGMGGIKRVLLANFSEISAVTVTEGKISAITMAASGKFKEYTFNAETGSMTSTPTIDRKTNVSYWQTNLVMQFAKMETAKRVEIAAMAQGELAAIVEDNNGIYWMLGQTEPVVSTAGNAQTGTARSDGNYYQITLTDWSRETPPLEVLDSIVDALVA